MENSEIGTSSSNTVGCEYQVFLNFRGPDTRHTFTNLLHQALIAAGITVFFDDEGLQPGERISDNLLQAIDNSKLYIPIFSQKYATSQWCLKELARMVENTSKYKEDGKENVILPIFYDVKPNDVKLKTTLYKDALSNLKEEMEKNNISSKDIKTWWQALEDVGGTKGWELEKYSSKAKLIQAVVDEVVVRLKTSQRHVTEDLVGMEDRIAAIKNLLDIDSSGVQFIGIYGMGGIGKTTLAKIIFNQLCPHFGRNCRFLENVRETVKTKDFVDLQKEIFSDISNSRVATEIANIDGGTNKIEETICNEKMLIVLDDVDEANQIQKLIGEKVLYPGTRILVTSRDKSVLNIKGFKYEFKDYELKQLSDKDALELFSKHAFNDSSPPDNYYTLSKDIVSTAGGLPLALQEIGLSLFGQKNKKIWEERLEKLRKTPNKGVLGKPKISYDALELDQQQKRKRETESAKQEGKRQRHVTGDLVGMEDQIAAIKKLLDIDSSDVRLIGIYGMGGIGKTILAKTIFDQLRPRFERNCSFLDDVREMAKTKHLVDLQKKLLSDISYLRVAHTIDNIDHGIKMIEDTICNKKALIVLDDVDEANQIQKLIGEKSLCPGTRIVVTTRDRSVLNIRRFKDDFVKYEMMQLNEKDALKLFSRHAFNDDSPPDNYYTLSRRIVSIVDGLPLALEAIGSMLFVVEEREKWEELLKELKETPHQNVLAKLRISYDALKLTEQQIFLDIACFFIGENKTNPIYVWKDCGFYPEDAIEVLINKCMIKELDDNSIWMHNQFRNLGRTIAKKEGIRLWDEDDIICKLRSIEEMKGKVQALCLRGEFGNPITVTSEQIKRFPHIRFLSLYEVICQGDFTGCLSELKWINLHCPYSIHHGSAIHRQWFEAIDSLHLENVVVVNLSGVDITQDVFKNLIKGARKLKVLSLHYNRLIRRTSTFPQNSVIEKLTISNFSSLVEIDCSIGKLTKLTDLSFELCVKLEKLPEQIEELQELQHLSLRCCNSLRELPNSVLKLESLTKLDVLGTRITRLPDSIGRLSSLSSINVSSTLIEKLPSTMSKLIRLQTLHLNHCDQIQELPELPRNLTTLQLTSTSLVTVPNLSYLVNLVELALSNGSESMAKSDIIQTCDLQWMGSLSKLSKLQFCFSNVCVSTIELASLPLQELTLHGVDVPAFKQLPPKLIVLELYDTRGKQVRPPPLEKETAIVSSGSTESGESEVLRQIEVKFMEEHKSSEGSVRLREEPGCNELQATELIDHWRGDFHFPSSLNMLRKFFLWGCPGVQDIQFVSTLESLLVFSVGGCTSLKRLGGLSNLKNLMELTLNRCWSLQVVEGINELEFLHQLKIDRCRSLERILDPSNSKIPGRCSILITGSGELPDCGQTSDTWESYRVRFFREEKSSFDFFS